MKADNLEPRIRAWLAAQATHPGRQHQRETMVDWLEYLIAEVDRLRADQVGKTPS